MARHARVRRPARPGCRLSHSDDRYSGDILPACFQRLASSPPRRAAADVAATPREEEWDEVMARRPPLPPALPRAMTEDQPNKLEGGARRRDESLQMEIMSRRVGREGAVGGRHVFRNLSKSHGHEAVGLLPHPRFLPPSDVRQGTTDIITRKDSSSWLEVEGAAVEPLSQRVMPFEVRCSQRNHFLSCCTVSAM